MKNKQPNVNADNVQWIVNDEGELGVKIGNRCFFLYKGGSLVYNGKHDDGRQMMYRPVKKREFGECCHPDCGPVDLDDSDTWKPLPKGTKAAGLL